MTDPLDLLAIMAHPDDAELLCGGALSKAAAQGDERAQANLAIMQQLDYLTEFLVSVVAVSIALLYIIWWKKRRRAQAETMFRIEST